MRENKLKKNINGKIIYLLIATMLLSMLSGCAEDEQITQDERNQQLIAEYAAGVVLKYKREHEPTRRPTEIPTEVPTEQPKQNEDDKKEKDLNDHKDDIPDATVSTVTDATGGTGAEGDDIAGTLGLDGFKINYSGYEVSDVYPAQEGNDLSF